MFSPESFRTVRWVRTLNLVLQAVLFLTLFAGLNYVARNHPSRFDLTQLHKNSLSPETQSYLKGLSRPVHLVITAAEENRSPELRSLVDEYVHGSADNPAGKITVEYLDIYQNRRRAEELGIGDTDLIVLICGENRRTVPVDDLYRIKNKEREAFQGEQALTAAILDVSSPERLKIYFVAGHGELQPTDTDNIRGLSLLRDQLRVRNFQVDVLDLATAGRVPPDAALLVIAAPSQQSGYTRAEQETLRQYLSAQAGRLILLLPPGQTIDRLGLPDLLFEWGVLVDDDLVIDTGRENFTDEGDLFLWAFVEHPITQVLINQKMPLRFGPSRTVRPDPGRTTASGLTVSALAATSKTAWGETSYRSRPPFSRDIADIRPLPGMKPDDRLPVVVASERVSVRGNLPFSVPGGRLVVFGTGDFISNQRIANNGNLSVFLNAVNWSVDRDRQLNIPARPIERFQLALSSAQFQRLRYTVLLALPGATLLLGLIVYWTRRA